MINKTYFIKFRKLSNITNKIQLPEKQTNQSYMLVNAPYAYAHTRVKCSECNCTKIMHVHYFRAFWVSSIQIDCSSMRVRSVPGLYESHILWSVSNVVVGGCFTWCLIMKHKSNAATVQQTPCVICIEFVQSPVRLQKIHVYMSHLEKTTIA